jgi:ABC-type multidrug transport system ATPase subunit
LFEDISLQFQTPSSTALLGINGSGKSTLLQIIATYILPGKGKVRYIHNGIELEDESVYQFISYSAPYLELIEEMTLREFFLYHFKFKKALIPVEQIIAEIGLQASQHKLIEKFSSGMKQRVKLAQAIFSDTPVLFLDEPCTNLDAHGIDLYHRLIETYTRNRILFVASNDENEYKVCRQFIRIDEFVPKPS